MPIQQNSVATRGPHESAVTPAPAAPGRGATLKPDLLASVVVFLVALPLCLGIANACGLPPALGLITGIVGGILVGVLAGCPLQVSGPAAGLVVVVAGIVQDETLGPAMLGVIVLAAGLLQLVAGCLRLGQWFRAVSPAVVEGMLAGIGVLIFASQFHVMVDDRPQRDGIANLLSIPTAVAKGVFDTSDTPHQEAALIGLLTIVTLVLWQLFRPRRLQTLPAQLVAIVAATAVCSVFDLPIARVPMPENLAATIGLPTWDLLQRVTEGPVLVAIFTVAFIASAETLLCATAVDGMHTGPRTRYDRELAAQGVGNLICGLVGALPMTGVIVRSAANVQAGARTRLSAILHGFWLLLTAVLFAAVLRQVPVAALAAVLVYTGFRLVNLQVIRELWRWGWSEVAIYLCTLIAVVATDLLQGVLLGLALSVVKLLHRFTHLRLRMEADERRGRMVLWIEGSATFLRLPQLAATLEQVPPGTELHVHIERLTYIDHACLELLANWETQHQAVGGRLVLDWNSLHARFHGDDEDGRNGPPGRDRSRNGAESTAEVVKA